MGDITEVTGMVLSAMPVGEFDRRIVLLTKERGKISAFAKGARRPNSPLTGVTRAFVFGTFQVYEGRTSYNIRQANITNYFESLLTDYDGVCYACYFAELADYYGRENLDASVMINLLYAAVRAVSNPNIPNQLIRYIYELRLIAINGENPDMFTCAGCGSEEKLAVYSPSHHRMFCENCKNSAGSRINAGSVVSAGSGMNTGSVISAGGTVNISDGIRVSQSTVYTLQYILTSPLERLFTFTVSSDVLAELGRVMGAVCNDVFDKNMKSLEMLP